MKKLLAFIFASVVLISSISLFGCEKSHQHEGVWHKSETTHTYQYTCGCESPDIAELHLDSDNNGFCDICGYEMPKSEKPANYFLREQLGAEWLEEITAEDIAEIKIISEAVGVAPGSLKNLTSSTDEAVIARIFEEYYRLDTTPISKMEGQIDGGGGVTVKFVLKNGTTKYLFVNNGNYLDTNGNYFELHNTPQFKGSDNATKAYGFITYLGIGTVYDKNDNLICEIPVDEFEFVESDGCVDAQVPGYYYIVKTEFGTLWFDYSNDLFYLQFDVSNDNYREYYQLVGKTLDELIAKYS